MTDNDTIAPYQIWNPTERNPAGLIFLKRYFYSDDSLPGVLEFPLTSNGQALSSMEVGTPKSCTQRYRITPRKELHPAPH